MKCSTCRWWLRFDDEPDRESGQCRRYPPTLTQGRVRVKGLKPPTAYGTWPEMLPDDWCGEWTAS